MYLYGSQVLHNLTTFAMSMAITSQIQGNIEENATEPGHSFICKIACASSEDSDQPAHLHRLIRVFAVRLKTLWNLGYLKSVLRRL